MINEIDSLIKCSLEDFVEEIFKSKWFGREREVVSLFTIKYLLPSLTSSPIGIEASQIGIEVAVPQLPFPGAKAQVNKDLVIWPKPFMTCWDESGLPVNYPLIVMEWKPNKQRLSSYDLDWLESYSLMREDFVGYACTLDLSARRFRLLGGRVFQGNANRNWLRL